MLSDYEFVNDADGVRAVDAACVTADTTCVSPLHNSFAGTRGAMLFMSMSVS